MCPWSWRFPYGHQLSASSHWRYRPSPSHWYCSSNCWTSWCCVNSGLFSSTSDRYHMISMTDGVGRWKDSILASKSWAVVSNTFFLICFLLYRVLSVWKAGGFLPFDLFRNGFWRLLFDWLLIYYWYTTDKHVSHSTPLKIEWNKVNNLSHFNTDTSHVEG